jgi:hypothetical protein
MKMAADTATTNIAAEAARARLPHLSSHVPLLCAGLCRWEARGGLDHQSSLPECDELTLGFAVPEERTSREARFSRRRSARSRLVALPIDTAI